jgi:hypothetical protein
VFRIGSHGSLNDLGRSALAKTITAVYVEATAEDTEARVLKGLRRQLPDLAGDLGLIDALSALRQDHSRESGKGKP